MNFIKPIIIKPTHYFNLIYNTYIKKPDHNESNFYILNLLKCHGYLITPIIITFENYIKFLNSNDKEYSNNLIDILNDNNKHIECNICLENVNKNEFVSTKCYHIFCLECYIKLNRNHLCKKNHDFINCPTCSKNYKIDDIYLVLHNNKSLKTKKNIYFNYIIQKLNSTHKLKDNSFEDILIYNLGLKGIYLFKKLLKNEYPINVCNNSLKVILSENVSWIYYMSKIIDPEHLIENNFFYNSSEEEYIFNNIVNLNKKILFLNFEMLKVFFKFLYNIKNQYNSRFKITFIFTEPYDYKKKECLTNMLNILLVNYQNKFNCFSFKQLIIKNTIDHKIFKDNAILY